MEWISILFLRDEFLVVTIAITFEIGAVFRCGVHYQPHVFSSPQGLYKPISRISQGVAFSLSVLIPSLPPPPKRGGSTLAAGFWFFSIAWCGFASVPCLTNRAMKTMQPKEKGWGVSVAHQLLGPWPQKENHRSRCAEIPVGLEALLSKHVALHLGLQRKESGE